MDDDNIIKYSNKEQEVTNNLEDITENVKDENLNEHAIRGFDDQWRLTEGQRDHKSFVIENQSKTYFKNKVIHFIADQLKFWNGSQFPRKFTPVYETL